MSCEHEVETWRPVAGYPGYEVSDLGKVRSYHKPGTGSKLGAVARILRPNRATSYPVVSLKDSAGVSRVRMVHLLLLEAFVGPRPSADHQGSHLDGNRQNCCLSNLCWEHRLDNNRRKYAHGTMAMHQRNGRAKLSAEQIAEIRRRRAAGEKQRALVAVFGVGESQISRICRGEHWREGDKPPKLLTAQSANVALGRAGVLARYPFVNGVRTAGEPGCVVAVAFDGGIVVQLTEHHRRQFAEAGLELDLSSAGVRRAA